jgi:hypothetical protein
VCTVTWLRREDGYDLLFNRDELKSRAEAAPPTRRQTDGTAWMAPVDGDFGGTWIATNEHGLTVGLLNGYRRRDTSPEPKRSRGLLVTDLAPSVDREDLLRRLEAADSARHRTFRLVAIHPGAPVLVAEWDGETLQVDREAEGRVPLVSSSFDEGGVGDARRAEYRRRAGDGPPTLKQLLAYHRSTTNGPSAYSVSMERPEAQTRGFTHVTVEADAVTLRYHAGRPDLDGVETALRLERQPLPSRAFRPPEGT